NDADLLASTAPKGCRFHRGGRHPRPRYFPDHGRDSPQGYRDPTLEELHRSLEGHAGTLRARPRAGLEEPTGGLRDHLPTGQRTAPVDVLGGWEAIDRG